jgi:hypothetical protein
VENDRLALLEPELADLLAEHGAPPTVLAACRLAAVAAGIRDGGAAQALEALSSAGPDRALAEVSQQLAVQYDQAAWAAQERGLDAEYDSLFRQARAAAALAFAHSGDARDALHEAAHAYGDSEQFANALSAALST